LCHINRSGPVFLRHSVVTLTSVLYCLGWLGVGFNIVHLSLKNSLTNFTKVVYNPTTQTQHRQITQAIAVINK